MTSSPWRIALLPLLAIAACGGSSGAAPQAHLLAVPIAASPQRGPSDAWVTIVEFVDFECPFCRSEEPVLAAVQSAYGGDVRFVFKHYPLTSIHRDAQAAAVAAQCAHEQGRFWEMHDLLLTTALDASALRADAGQVLGLDVANWETCIGGTTAAIAVAADVALGKKVGVPGTPTLVVNGRMLVGAIPEATLRAVIDSARSDAIASGIPRAEYYDRAVLGP